MILDLEASECQWNYEINKCHPSERVPALAQTCLDFEVCRQRKNAKEISVLVEAFGHILDKFISQQSITSILKIIFVALIISFFFVFKKKFN